MYICNLCEGGNKKIPQIDPKSIVNHLLVTQDKRGMIHVHGPVNNQMLMKMFIQVIAKEAGIEMEEEERVAN